MRGAGYDAGSIFLDVSRPPDVLTVVSPSLGGAEASSSQLAVKDSSHLDAVRGLEDVAAVGEVARDHHRGWVPGLGAAKVARRIALEAVDPGHRDRVQQEQ